MELERFLIEKKDVASSKALDKAEECTITKELFLPEYLWRSKDEVREIPAYLFRVEKDGKYHNVVLTKKDQEWFIWCGDAYLRNKGYEESYCYQWRNRDAICHHIVAVINHIQKNPDLAGEISRKFGEGTETSELRGDEFSIAYEMKLPILLYGPTGSGKSHSALQFIKEIQKKEDVEFFQINMSSGLEDVDLLAKMIPDPESGKWSIRDGELWKAFKKAKEKPVVILIEELTRSTKSARNLLLKAMDSVSGKYQLQNFVIGEAIEVPTENIWWIATANIGYSDTEEMDPALMRRFLITKFVDYSSKELQVLKEIVKNEQLANSIMKMAKLIRRLYKRGEVPYPIDTGTLKTFAMVLVKTKNPLKAAEMTFLYRLVEVDSTGYPIEEQVEILREIIRDVFGK